MATRTPSRPRSRVLKRLLGGGQDRTDQRLIGPIRGELFGPERLAAHARTLAQRQVLLPRDLRRDIGPLLRRLHETRAILEATRAELSESAHEGLDISPAGEWLLDNYYIVEEQIRGIRTNLPAHYYRELPKLATGVLAGYPRVYEIAIELIGHSEGHLSLENIELVVREFQRFAPLSMGELWAIPSMLRLGLVENIRRMALRTSQRLAEIRSAEQWARRLRDARRSSERELAETLARFVDNHPPLTAAFVSHFLHQIRTYETDFTPLLWLEEWIAEDSLSVGDAVSRANQRTALTQVMMANSITSLRALALLDWKKFFEFESVVEAVLREDPSEDYARMTFETRDTYRHVVERLAKRTRKPEAEIASVALRLARTGKPGEREHHIGYWLFDEGLEVLEKDVGYRPHVRERLHRATLRHPDVLYFGAILTATALVLWMVLNAVAPATFLGAIAVFIFAIVPANELAVSVVNQIVTFGMPPLRLPKLEFRETGIPEEYRSVVAVPTLFPTAESVQEMLDHVEVQFLANRDPNLLFAVLGDFTDADSETLPEDAAILQAAISGVRALNNKYAGREDDVFYLLHRPRRWNAAQGKWMGWERKRGKLAEFNRFLRGGARKAFMTVIGDVQLLSSARYVLPMDSDTVLPREAGAVLVGTLAHPLNRAVYDEDRQRVVEGYSILQPRVSVWLPSAHRSLFAAIHSVHPGVDPYTTAVSDVYQDLYAEGSYTGKGIYDVDAFEKAVKGRFPENTLLSHDLIESTYARAALVTDLEVYDDYPTRYLTFIARKDRWIRGDWQLLRWLGRIVPGPDGPTRNTLSVLSQWKIFDNLRRSVVEIAQVALLIAAWIILPFHWHGAIGTHPVTWTLIALVAIAFPWLFSLLLALIRPPIDQSLRAYYSAVGRDAWSSSKQFALYIAFLPHQAVISLVGIVRTLYRLYVSHRFLLEWRTASHVERTTSAGRGTAWRAMLPAPLLAAVVIALVVWRVFGSANPPDAELLALLATSLPILVSWFLSPEIAHALGAPAVPGEVRLNASERGHALRYAGLHWRYWDKFVSESTQWLAPDNFQEDPKPIIAARTSPTNIGLQMLSTVSAHDLGFITREDMIGRLELVFRSLERMRRFRGHFYNWYDLLDLRVLEPAYVSTVDSGNLAASLIALKQACLSMSADMREAAANSTEISEQAVRLEVIANRANQYALEMDFRFLFDEMRKLFSIGYRESEGSFDDSFYDLLASEARLASFLAIAKNDVPVEHWFRLGRSLTGKGGDTALASWSGSMFEYLMPLLVMRRFPMTLLDQTYHAAVNRHIAYGRSRGVPWGVSESAYNLRDRDGTYQYRGFGVPNLGLKRGLGKDLVVAPYATLLALLVEPRAAMHNLYELEKEGALGEFGFRDAIDYTRTDPQQKSAVVGAYMSHHIGMGLVSLANALTRQIWQRRFHADPLVQSAELLLHERIPRRLFVTEPQPLGAVEEELRAETSQPAVREIRNADTPQPRIALLGYQPFTMMVTNAGGSYSRFENMAITRWRADATRDNYGQWCYVRDLASARVWSNTHQPTRVEPDRYEVHFSTDRVVFHRVDGEIETRTEIAVVPDDRAEVRRITVINRSDTEREIELTSYGEIVLAPADAERAHPAFANLFVQTEWLPSHNAILASRRPRAATDRTIWLVHVIAGGAELIQPVTYETDRARFIGRGRSTANPAALDSAGALSCTTGAVLDPMFALRARLRVSPGQSARVAFTTIVAPDRDTALAMADRYDDPYAAQRALDLSWTHAQVELRESDVEPADATLYQQLAGHLLYPHAAMRPPQSELQSNRLGQAALWSMGISGDWPILLARIDSADGLPSVRQLLRAHHYWRLKGVTIDLVILNAHAPSYMQELSDRLMETVLASTEAGLLDRPGGIFIRRKDLLSNEDLLLLRTTARVHVNCDGLGLGRFLDLPENMPGANAPFVPRIPGARHYPGDAAPVQPAAPLRFANPLGGVTANGDYEIRLTPGTIPPAPWSNIIANERGGSCVTESGGGFTWAENSYFFRITPWYNDPVCDPPTDVLYLRDDETGEAWCPTPAPLARKGSYLVRHATGQSTFEHQRAGIRTVLTVNVPERDPVRMSVLRLENRTSVPRTLTLTSFVEWALGVSREHTQHQVHTRFDSALSAILAANYFDPQFASLVAFASVSEPVSSHTADRREFLGRNRGPDDPAALFHASLSGTTGACIDPCSALQCRLLLQPGETREVVVLLGAGTGDAGAAELIQRYGRPERATQAGTEAVARWSDRLDIIQIETPVPDLDVMVNRWTLYQALACRMWARSALYQSGGAYGFRDQLQDSMAFLYAEPAIARGHILRAAARQFVEGDVQHWWHPHSGRGVRTRFSDDLAWLPFVVEHYVRVTGDASLLDERVPYLSMRTLDPHEHEVYDLPQVADETGTIYEHCVRALHKACTHGLHDLPLIGIGDWNDGMNRVGYEGRGVSVWLAWFLATTLRRFTPFAVARTDAASKEAFDSHYARYVEAIETNGWDGAWYRRAYFDDGSPLGTATSSECRIDSVAQTWSVISSAGDPARRRQAMQSLNEHLVNEEARLILLLKPPFDKTGRDPGYIKGYLPGVRENGAQYTHAALWVVLATAMQGDGDRAVELLQMINPLTRTRDQAGIDAYKVEPYVVAADIYSMEQQLGRGGWTWYTGSASWMYRVALESILGFSKVGATLTMNPCVPATWDGFSVHYRFASSVYHITVQNPEHVCRGVRSVALDGAQLTSCAIPLIDDGAEHAVTVTLGATIVS